MSLEHLHLRICTTPILRKLYLVTYEDGATHALYRDYIYNYTEDMRSSKHSFELLENHPQLAIFKEEFEYLWKQSISFSEWVVTTISEH